MFEVKSLNSNKYLNIRPMTPTADLVRLKGDMSAFVRASEQLQSAILANEQGQSLLSPTVAPSSEEPSVITSSGSLSRVPATNSKKSAHVVLKSSISDENQQFRTSVSASGRQTGPPPYRASTDGSWGGYSATVTSIINKIYPEEEKDGQIVEEKGSGTGGNVLSNWLKKQKAAECLAKITGREEVSPRLRHIETLVQLACGSHGHASTVLSMVAKRPVLSDRVIALKCLVLMHHLMLAGTPDVMSASIRQQDTIQEIIRFYSKKKGTDPRWSIVCSYGSSLIEKIKFHRRFPDFDSSYSIDFRQAPGSGAAHCLDALAGLQSTLDQSILCLADCLANFSQFGRQCRGQGQLSGQGESDPAGLLLFLAVPAFLEAELIHKACMWLLELLDKSADAAERLPKLKEHFSRQHATLRRTFLEASDDSVLTSAAIRLPVFEEEPVCLAPPPLISTNSFSREWLWPEEAERESLMSDQSTAGPSNGGSGRGSASGRTRLSSGASSGELDEKLRIIGGVGAATEAALQKHAAGRPISSPDGSPHIRGNSNIPALNPGPPIRLPSPVPSPNAGNSPSLNPTIAAVPPPELSQTLAGIPQRPAPQWRPPQGTAGVILPPAPNPSPPTITNRLQQLQLQQIQVQKEGQWYLKQQQERVELQQRMEMQKKQVAQQVVQTLEQVRFADLLAQSPYKPDLLLRGQVGMPLNQAGIKLKPQGQVHGQGAAKIIENNNLAITGPPMVEEETTKSSLVPEWEITYSELRLGAKIGQGAFGDVVKGYWQGTEIAVKRLQNMAADQYSRASVDFRREVELVMKLRHPNVILFMGACTTGKEGELCIVMEYAKNGSLYHVLHNPAVKIDFGLVVRWALEAAKGMNYLHTRSPTIVHRDLKSVNLLVDEDWHIKVSDFGLARTKASSYTNTQVGTWGWMAPEVLDKQPYDEMADVYSFGIVLWELITRDEPFKGMHPLQIMRAVDKGERPALPDSCPGPYRQLVNDCWQKNPRLRPRFNVIIERLIAMESAYHQLQYSSGPGTFAK